MLPLILECWTAACAAIVHLNCVEASTLHQRLLDEYFQEDGDDKQSRYSDPIRRDSSQEQPIQGPQKLKKRVSFTENTVFIVPNRDDLFKETAKEIIWYNAENIAEFKKSTLEEVEYCMTRTGIHEIRRAFRCLYQPAAVYNATYANDVLVY